MEVQNHNWYAVITAKVLLNKRLTDKQKLLIALISNLQNEKGFCFASNRYLAECLDCSEVTIRQNISRLEELGFLGRELKLNSKNEIEFRTLTIVECFNVPIKNNQTPPIKNNTPSDENQSDPSDENQSHNNKVLKTNNNILSSFEIFWGKYNKKIDKSKTFDRWKKLTSSEIEKILKVLPKYLEKQKDVQFRKNPLTWLNGKCWEDEEEDINLFSENENTSNSKFLSPISFMEDYING